MKFATRLRIGSYLSLGMLAILVPLLAWSHARTNVAKHDDELADNIQVKVYERIVFRDEYILYQGERAKAQWLAATEGTDLLLTKAAHQYTDQAELLALAEMRKNFDDTVVIFKRILALTERTKDADTDKSFHDSEMGKRLFSQLLLRAFSLQQSTYRLQKLTEHRLAQANNRSTITTTLFILAAVLSTFLNALLLNRTVRLRLEALHDGARSIAEGNLDFRINLQGADEFTALANTINAMTQRVQASSKLLQASHDLLGGLSRQVPGILFQAHLSCDGRISIPYASETIHTIYELSPEDVCEDATPIFARFHPDDHDGLIASFHESAQSLTPWEYTYRVVLPRQGEKWCRGVARPQALEDGSCVWYGFIADITALKVAEKTLIDSEERYRAVVEDQTDIICRFQMDGTLLFVNDVYCRFFGKVAKDLIGSKWHPEAVPDDIPLIEEKLRLLSPSNPVVVIENRVHSGTGDVRWMQFVNRGFFDDMGQLTEIQAVGRDITERKDTETKLQKAMEKAKLFSEAMDSLTTYIYIKDRQHRYVHANRPVLELFNCSAEELPGNDDTRFFPPETVARLKTVDDRVLEHGETTHEEIDVNLNSVDRRVYWEVKRPLYDDNGEIWGLCGVSTDITDRKNLELKLAESELQFRTLVMNAPFLVTNVDRHGTIGFINRCSDGFSSDTVIGTSSYDYLEGESKEMYRYALEKVFEQQATQRIMVRGFGDNRTIRWFESVLGPIVSDGSVVSAIQVTIDITERKEAEEILANVAHELERQVTERTASLTHVNEQLRLEIEERMRAEAELLDYQQRLEALGQEISLAEERERGRIAGELHDQVGQRLILGKMKLQGLANGLSEAEQSALAEDINMLLAKSIQDIRSLTFQLRPPILANAGLVSAIQWLGEEFRETYGLETEFVDDQQPKLLPYEIRASIFQAVREILLNVVKHAQCRRASIHMNLGGEGMVIEISDNGRGFNPALIAARKTSAGGFGLFNVRKKIEYLGGQIDIDSQPDRGTRVTIRVPLGTPESREG